MKKHLFKFALTLFVCMLSNAALAVEDSNIILSEDFAELPNQSIAYPTSYNNWELFGCTSRVFSTGSTKIPSLKVEKKTVDSKENAGYAITPELGYTGNVLLSFSYATQSNTTTSTIKVSITNGTFDDNEATEISKNICNSYENSFVPTSYKLNNVTNNTKITFTQEKYNNKYVSFYIDDVKVIKLGEITLNDQINSSEAIAANNETSCTVKTVRTLKANIWNTLCLPFDVNMSILEAALGTGKNIELRTYSNYDAENKVMNFEVADNSTIEAGTPFLIKLNTENTENTENTYEFTGVTIKNVAAKTIESNGVSFVGTYSPVELNTDGTHIFITTDNKIAKPLEGKNEMKGLRAYITVPSGFDFNDARLFLDDEATAINNIGTQKATNSVTLFNLQGQRVEHPRSGLYIKNNKLTIIR